MLIVNEIVDILFNEFNCGKSETSQMMPHCRFAVEKFIFEKLYSRLFKMYEVKHKKFNDKFSKKQKEIFISYTKLEIFNFLELKRKF
jgi:hypothetical protein